MNPRNKSTDDFILCVLQNGHEAVVMFLSISEATHNGIAGDIVKSISESGDDRVNVNQFQVRSNILNEIV